VSPVKLRNILSGVTSVLLILGLTGCRLEDTTGQIENQRYVVQHFSPLDEYVAILWGTRWDENGLSFEDQSRMFQNELAQRENLIAQCMRDEGFDYIPNIAGQHLIATADGEWNPNDRNWVENFGFGIFAADIARPGSFRSTAESDPNYSRLATLSDSERAAFEFALVGPAGQPGFEFTDTTDLLNNLGCTGWAAIQMQHLNEISNSAEFAPLIEAIDDLRSNLLNELTEADREWAACMANAGHADFQRQNDAEAFVQGQIFNLREDMLSSQFEAMRALELELALADFDCREATNYDQRVQAHRIEVETQFVNDNRHTLEALRAAAEQHG